MQHFKDGEVVKDRVRERRRRIKHGLMGADVPLQEPILITDTGKYILCPDKAIHKIYFFLRCSYPSISVWVGK